jgi:hypothetical protein
MLPAIIQELLIKIKTKLKDGTTKDETISRDLHKIASLAQSFTELRLRSSKKSLLSDFLDQEGSYHCSASVRTNMKPQVSRFRCQPVECVRRSPSRLCV